MDVEMKQPDPAVEEARAWMRAHQREQGLAGRELARRSGIAHGTLSQFLSDKGYPGDERRVAEEVAIYRGSLEAQAAVEITPRPMPGYYPTETSKRLKELLQFCRMGEIVMAACTPGLGKTMTADHFAATTPNAFVVTMTPSTSGVNNMQIEVLESIGATAQEMTGAPHKLSRNIRTRLMKMRNPVLIFDEAQNLSIEAIDQIRSWNDKIEVGIAFFGDLRVEPLINGSTGKNDVTQLGSRLSLRVKQAQSMQGDVEPLAQAWGIEAPDMIAWLRDIVMKPGGLRGASKALRLGWMLADAEQQPLNLGHLQDARAQLSGR